MPRRKRVVSMSFYIDDKDYGFEEKYDKEEFNNRAPRNAANARERARMRVLSKAFCRLKTTLPWVPADTKLSKLDTLRLAATYIAHLRAVLRDNGDDTCTHHTSSKSPAWTLSWPFAIPSASLPILSTNGDCDPSSTPPSTCSISTSIPPDCCSYKDQQTLLKVQNLYQLNHNNHLTHHNYDSSYYCNHA